MFSTLAIYLKRSHDNIQILLTFITSRIVCGFTPVTKGMILRLASLHAYDGEVSILWNLGAIWRVLTKPPFLDTRFFPEDFHSQSRAELFVERME